MDLNARPPRSFWDLFRCCHDDGNEEQHDCPSTTAKLSSTNNYAFVPMKHLDTKTIEASSAAAAETTPTTVATADFSFDSHDSNLEAPIEEENIFDTDISVVAQEAEVPKEQEHDGKNENDFNEQDASFIYENMRKAASQEEDDDDLIGINYVSFDEEEDSSPPASPAQKQSRLAGIMNFYRFFIFMILRHMFGPLLLRSFNESSSLQKFFLLKNTSHQDETQKMNLNRLKLNEKEQDSIRPGVPKLQEDEILL